MKTSAVIAIVALVALGGGAILCAFIRAKQGKGKAKSEFPKTIPFVGEVNSSVIDTLDFSNVVGWFKNLKYLDKERHVPFIANAEAEAIKSMITFEPQKKYIVLLGVYDETTDEIIEKHLIHADKLDEKTQQVLGNETLVVLN